MFEENLVGIFIIMSVVMIIICAEFLFHIYRILRKRIDSVDNIIKRLNTDIESIEEFQTFFESQF